MNIDNGEILAMGSYPSYDPTELIEPDPGAGRQLYRDPILAPLVNRATEGALSHRIDLQDHHRPGGAGKRPDHPGHGGPGQRPDRSRHQNLRKRRRRRSRRGRECVRALQVSSDVYFYMLGLDMWKTSELQEWAHKLGIGRASRARPARGRRRAAAEQILAQPALRRRTDRSPLVGRRQHPARDRAGGPADQPAADGARLCGAGQRRQDRRPRTSAGSGGRGGAGAEGIRLQAPAQDPHRPRLSHRDPGRPARRRAGRREAPPSASSAASRSRSPARRERRNGAATATNHGSRSLAPYPNPRIVTVATVEEGGFGAESAAPAASRSSKRSTTNRLRRVSSAGGAE